jgi:hypothetical protein
MLFGKCSMSRCFIVRRENMQPLGTNVCFPLPSHDKHRRNKGFSSSNDNYSGSDFTDTSELAQQLSE